jgi:hypothetical protein
MVFEWARYKNTHFLATHMMQLLPLYGLWLNTNKQAVGGVYETRLIWTTSISG